jgi:glycosyltransferase involved in cell wall biosynthesis
MNIPEADLVILGGWTNEYQQILRGLKAKGIKTAVWFMSSLGQSGFTPQLCELSFLSTIFQLMDAKLIDYLVVGGRKIYYPLRNLHDNIILLPFPFNYTKYAEYRQGKTPWKIVFFSPKHTYKNVVNQLAALALAQQSKPQLDVHVNNLAGSGFDAVADLFKLKYTSHGWLQDKEYYAMLSSAACSMQVTYAEVCNYGAMTSMAMGTPTLLSNVVDWLPHTKLNRNLIVGRFDSPEHLAEKILHAAENPEQYADHVQRMIRRVADSHNQAVNHILRELVE